MAISQNKFNGYIKKQKASRNTDHGKIFDISNIQNKGSTDSKQIKKKKLKTFDSFDQLHLKSFCKNLINHSLAEYPHVEGSLVISLNGKFGSGKSCFLEMMENYLNDIKEYDVIHINAWENDFFDEPIITIASEIIKHLDQKIDILSENRKKETAIKLKEAFVTVIGNIANQGIKKTTGIDLQEAIKDKNQKIGNSIYKQYCEKSHLFENINDVLTNYLSDSLEKKPLFILVDELDRSRPNYTVNFLETLTHLFQTKGIVFILGVNKAQLESSIRCLYGDLDFSEYYRKFIHRNVTLPKPNENTSKSYIKAKIEENFRDNDFYTNEVDTYKQETIYMICSCCFNFSLRQINEFFRILSYTLITKEGQKKNDIVFYSAITYIAILMNDEKDAEKIRNNSFQYSDYIKLFQKFQATQEDVTWFNWFARIMLFATKPNTQRDTSDCYIENMKYYIKHFNPEIADDEIPREIETIKHQQYSYGHFGQCGAMSYISKKVDECLNFFED